MGPFVIEKQVNKVAYRVRLPEHMKIHDVFHISLLHPYKESGRIQPPPPPLQIEGEWEYEVQEVLNERAVRRNRRKALNSMSNGRDMVLNTTLGNREKSV